MVRYFRSFASTKASKVFQRFRSSRCFRFHFSGPLIEIFPGDTEKFPGALNEQVLVFSIKRSLLTLHMFYLVKSEFSKGLHRFWTKKLLFLTNKIFEEVFGGSEL